VKRLLAAAGAALALTIAVAAAPAVTARPGGQPVASEELTLIDQTAWVPPDGDLALAIADPVAPPGATLHLSLHDRVSGRIQFEQSLSGERLGPTVSDSPPLSLDEPSGVSGGGWVLAASPDRIDVTLATRDTGPADPNRVLVADQGVYPLAVELLDANDEVIARVVTHLLRLPDADDESPPLGVSLVVPVHAPIALKPDGTTALTDEALVDLTDVLTPLAGNPGVPLAVVPTPETIAAMGSDGSLGDLLRGSLEDRQVLASTYVELDAAAWVAAGLSAELADQLTTGADAVATALDVRADRRTWVAGPTVTPDTLTALGDLGVDQVIVPQDAVAPLDEDQFAPELTQRFALVNSSGAEVQAISTIDALQSHVGATDDAILDAHNLLADLAVLYFDQPALQRGTTVVLPPGRVDPEFLGTLLEALTQPSLVAAQTPDTLFASARAAREGGQYDDEGPPLVRTLAPEPAASLGSYPGELRESRAELDGFRALVGPESEMLSSLTDLQLVSGAASLTPTEQSKYLDSVSDNIEATAAGIHVEPQAVNLTQRSGEIPIAIRNDLDHPVTVVITFESEKLEFPEGNVINQTLPPGRSAVTVAVETRASGAFPVDVHVTAPNGLVLTEERFTVRSTTVSGLGIVLSIIAALFLLIWWARHFRKMRRASRLVPADEVDEPVDETSPAEAPRV
jgi:hypothetical protein